MRQPQLFAQAAGDRHCEVGAGGIDRVDLMAEDMRLQLWFIQNIDLVKMPRNPCPRAVHRHRGGPGLAPHPVELCNRVHLDGGDPQNQNLFHSIPSP